MREREAEGEVGKGTGRGKGGEGEGKSMLEVKQICLTFTISLLDSKTARIVFIVY